MQLEIVHWLNVERVLPVSTSTVCRFLKDRGWNRRTLRSFSVLRNEDLRQSYRISMRKCTAEDLIFLDESIFNEDRVEAPCLWTGSS